MVPPGSTCSALTFALFKAGAVPVLIDPGIGRRHLGAASAEAEPEAFIGVPTAQLARARPGVGPTDDSAASDGRRPAAGARREPRARSSRSVGRGEPGDAVAAGADETAAILFTSGSTGPPKGVVYRHAIFVRPGRGAPRALRHRPGEIDLPTFPLFALFGPALGMTTVVPDMDADPPGPRRSAARSSSRSRTSG